MIEQGESPNMAGDQLYLFWDVGKRDSYSCVLWEKQYCGSWEVVKDGTPVHAPCRDR